MSSTDESQPPVIDERFNAGFDAAIDSIRQSLDGLQRVVDYSNHPATRTRAAIDEEFIKDTVAWARSEWPTIGDAVQEKLAGHRPQPEDMMRGLTALVLTRLAGWLEQPDVAHVLTEYKRAMQTIEFYSTEFIKLLHGNPLLTDEHREMPPIAQGLAALKLYMSRVEELEGQMLVRTAAETEWAAAANMMNGALDGQIENDDTTVPLIERFQKYLRRVGEESWNWQEYLSKDHGGEDN